ncbi:MAG: ribulose-phosphate 3-epimerase [Candidatus Micrarchaeota archaeon]|nr:ribulose-phosphate 3-epimerase [Candidatus Micrarchaeota archaeon]
MKKKVIIAPSILAADLGNLRSEVKRLDKAGADCIHIDIMDGKFVKNITFGPTVVSSIRDSTYLPFELHLMIERPDLYIDKFAQAGSDLITVHYESNHNISKTIGMIRSHKIKAGIAISPETSFQKVSHFIPDVSQLLVMSVHPGFGGQKFIKESINKIKEASSFRKRNNLDTIIAVDGGITLETGKEAVAAGADELIAGTAILKSKNFKDTIQKFRSITHD